MVEGKEERDPRINQKVRSLLNVTIPSLCESLRERMRELRSEYVRVSGRMKWHERGVVLDEGEAHAFLKTRFHLFN